MSFTNFINPYRNPDDVPEGYRNHPNLSKLFKADTNQQKLIGAELEPRSEAKRSRIETEARSRCCRRKSASRADDFR